MFSGMSLVPSCLGSESHLHRLLVMCPGGGGGVTLCLSFLDYRMGVMTIPPYLIVPEDPAWAPREVSGKQRLLNRLFVAAVIIRHYWPFHLT